MDEALAYAQEQLSADGLSPASRNRMKPARPAGAPSGAPAVVQKPRSRALGPPLEFVRPMYEEKRLQN